jgi:hypothetical protein
MRLTRQGRCFGHGTTHALGERVEDTNEPSALLTSALATLASSAIVLDGSLRVIAATRASAKRSPPAAPSPRS